jgi:hypothetical protein
MSNWGGYAANQGAFYLNEDAYLLIGSYTPGYLCPLLLRTDVAGGILKPRVMSIVLGRHASDAVDTRCE